MEAKLYEWYKEMTEIKKEKVTARMIKQMALDITKHRDFLASKGWMEKFKLKYNLKLSRSKTKLVLKNSI
jgi:hypothetical protein